MTSTIYRHEVPVDDLWHTHALYGDPLGVLCRDRGVVEFWAVAHPGLGALGPRRFRVFGTGHEMPDGLKHWGIAQDGPLIWHLMEAVPDA